MTRTDPARVGVYVCHCGSNIAATVDVVAVAAGAAALPNVTVARDSKYMCSSTGQELIRRDVAEFGLNRVVVASCSPRMHEPTFRAVLAEAGLNPYLLNMANIREHCSWITRDRAAGTRKAQVLVSGAVRRVVWQEALEEREVPVLPSTLVVGGGIAGIQAALAIAEAGYHVTLVEKETSIGGRMAQLDKTFPTLDCSACILTPKMVQAARHPNITVLTNAEVEEVGGYVGRFNVRVRQKARYVDAAKCSGCGECSAICPVSIPHEFDQLLSQRKAIYRLFPQAVPAAFAIDKQGMAPCRAACPAGVNVQGYVTLIRAGKYDEALALIRRDLPFPGVCGRVCTHPCEAACSRGELEGAVSIRALKRFVADQEVAAWERAGVAGSSLPAITSAPGPKIAVVGSGPAGLTCASQLARCGYAVTVFEALPVAGGMMAVGIPQFRLPRAALQHEIAAIQRQGVEIHTNSALGRHFSLLDLFRRGHTAVFLAIGAHCGQKLGVPGERLKGVFDGITFLRKASLAHLAEEAGRNGARPVSFAGPLGRVAVFGGGNTAVDAARTALRLDAEEVTIYYRRTRAEMPVSPWELDAAEKEGIKIQYLVTPAAILGDKRVSGLRLRRMRLEAPVRGAGGTDARPRPVPVAGSEFEVAADTVITAIGQSPEAGGLDGLEVTAAGGIAADPWTCETNLPGVFAGGDAAGGPATVIDAVAWGNRAAESIDRFLQGKDMREGRSPHPQQARIAQPRSTDDRVFYPRTEVPELAVGRRWRSYAEVERGYDEMAAQREAGRCLDCGGCAECMECVKACGPAAIDHHAQDQIHELEVGTVILATGHKFFNPIRSPQYHYGRFANILDSMEFERMCNASGPTGGEILTVDGRTPESIVFIHCVGSRDSHANTYCSRLCCMHAMKQAHLAKERTGADVYELYIDIRAAGKGYEEFYERVQREGVIFIRGRGAEVISDGGKLIVRAEDTGLGRPLTLPVDMVVLVTGMEAQADSDAVAKTFHITRDKDGFFMEAHPKLRPFNTNTDGIFLAGTCQAPRDIPDTVAHASAAAAEAMSLMGHGRVTIEPTIAQIEAEYCSGCRVCNNLCAYGAITYDCTRGVSEINPALCKGCGTCVAACPSGAAQAQHYRIEQVFAEIEGLLAL